MESIDQSLFIAATSLLAAMYEVGAMSWNSGPIVLSPFSLSFSLSMRPVSAML